LHKAHAAEEKITTEEYCATLDVETLKLFNELENDRVQANIDYKHFATLPEEAASGEELKNSQIETLLGFMFKVQKRLNLIQAHCAKLKMSSVENLAELEKNLKEDLSDLGYELTEIN